MQIPNFVNKINFQQVPGTPMPPDNLLMYLEKYIIAPAEEKCGYGIYSKAREIPIFFVSEKTINQQRLAIARGVFGDLRKLLDFVDDDRFGKLWENEFGDLRKLLGFVDNDLREKEFGNLRKLLDFVDECRFWELWENEFNTTECPLDERGNNEILEGRRARFPNARPFGGRNDYKEALEEFLVKWADPIGLYLPNGMLQAQGPEIWVSYEKICNLYPNPQDSKYTTALTLVHELCHAIMDAPTSGLYCLNTWVEEPLANMIALYYLDSVGPSKSYGNARMDYVTNFVKTQSANYALGLNLFRSNRVFDWKAWKNAKWLLCFKNDVLVDWVEYIKGNLANVDDRCLEDLFREIVRQPIEFDQTLLQQAEKLYEK